MIRINPDKIAIIPMRDPDKIGSIWVPDMAKERTDQGIIKYIGRDVPPDFAIGQHVLFSGYAGTLVDIEGEGNLIIMHHEMVIAELPDPPTIEIPGLYFMGINRNFYPATYEMAMEFIAAALRETEWFRKIDVKTLAPTQEDYEKGRMK